MSALYEKLKDLDPNLTKEYVREQGLPTWWNDECDQDNDVVLEGAGHISQRMNVNLLSLLQDERPKFKDAPQGKIKPHHQGAANAPETAYHVASSVATTVARATNLEFKPVPINPQQIRRKIIKSFGRVSASSLLDYCWEHGIAVVHFNHYPKGSREITGMIQRQDDQPVIVLSGGSNYPDLLAFHLAYELSHLALDHLKPDKKILIDSVIDSGSDDPEDQASNQFAMSLLIDTINDPNRNEGQCAKSITNSFLAKRLDWEDLSEDTVDHLEVILGK